MQEKRSIEELNYIRGVAAIFVMLFHYTSRYPELFNGINTNGWISLSWGSAGVNVFFLLSGFLTVYTMKEDMPANVYIKKRAKRLYPEYWICLIFTTLILFVLNPSLFVGWKAFFVNLTMFQGFVGVPNVDGVYWTLAYELRFYLFIFILLAIKRFNKIRTVTFVWMILSFSYYLIFPIVDISVLTKAVDFVFMPQYCAPFAVGIFLYYFVSNNNKLSSAIGIAVGITLSAVSQELPYFIFLDITVLIVILIFVVRKNNNYINHSKQIGVALKPLSFIARISFPLYLIHQYFGYCILRVLSDNGFNHEAFIVIPVVLSISIAAVVHVLVDKRSRNELYKKFARKIYDEKKSC